MKNRGTLLYLSIALGVSIVLWYQFFRGIDRLTDTEVRELMDRVDDSYREGFRYVDCSLRTQDFVLHEESRDLAEPEASGFEVVTRFESGFDAETDELGARSFETRTLSRADYCRSAGPNQWTLDNTELRRTRLEIVLDAEAKEARYKAHYIRIAPANSRQLESTPGSCGYSETDETGVVAIEDRKALIRSSRRLTRNYWLRLDSVPPPGVR
jgi:hypothetical protein